MAKSAEVDSRAVRVSDDAINETVEAMYEKGGTTRDAYDMDRLGKRQVLQRNFSYYSIFGFAMILMSTWEVILACVFLYLSVGIEISSSTAS